MEDIGRKKIQLCQAFIFYGGRHCHFWKMGSIAICTAGHSAVQNRSPCSLALAHLAEVRDPFDPSFAADEFRFTALRLRGSDVCVFLEQDTRVFLRYVAEMFVLGRNGKERVAVAKAGIESARVGEDVEEDLGGKRFKCRR